MVVQPIIRARGARARGRKDEPGGGNSTRRFVADEASKFLKLVFDKCPLSLRSFVEVGGQFPVGDLSACCFPPVPSQGVVFAINCTVIIRYRLSPGPVSLPILRVWLAEQMADSGYDEEEEVGMVTKAVDWVKGTFTSAKSSGWAVS